MSPFDWRNAPSATGRRAYKSRKAKLFTGLQTTVNQPGNIYIVGAEQSEADHQRRDALKRCIPMGPAR